MQNSNNSIKDKYIYIKFILIFCISFSMIVWTIVQTSKAGVGLDDDNAFLSTYHDVDSDYNKMMLENAKFLNKYKVLFYVNGVEIDGLSVEDIYLSQRVIKDRKEKKHLFKVGKNSLEIKILDLDGKEISKKLVNILVTKSTTHEYDVKLKYDNESVKTFDVATVGYWNITGTIEVGENKGYFYIKTNATK